MTAEFCDEGCYEGDLGDGEASDPCEVGLGGAGEDGYGGVVG